MAAPLGSGAVPALNEMEAAGDPTLNSPVGEGEVWKTPASAGTTEEEVEGDAVSEEEPAPPPAEDDDACCAAEGSAAKKVFTVFAACKACESVPTSFGLSLRADLLNPGCPESATASSCFLSSGLELT